MRKNKYGTSFMATSSVQNALGYFLIVKDFDSFLTWFLGKMEVIKAKKGGENE